MRAQAGQFSWSASWRDTRSGKSLEESNPYESLLVSLNRAVRQGSVPDEYQSVPVTSEVLQVPAGLRATADRVWVGHHLKVVRYSLDNVSLSARMVRESDFWQPEHVPSCSVPRQAC